MSSHTTKRRMPSDLPNRVVASILGIICIGFLAHMNMNYHDTGFKTPLVLVSTLPPGIIMRPNLTISRSSSRPSSPSSAPP